MVTRIVLKLKRMLPEHPFKGYHQIYKESGSWEATNRKLISKALILLSFTVLLNGMLFKQGI